MLAMTSKSASPTLLFWVHNILAFAFIDVFYGLYVPLHMILPSEKVSEQGPRFELSTAPKILEPRRYLEVGGWREEERPVEPSTPPTSPLALPSRFSKLDGLTLWQVMNVTSKNHSQIQPTPYRPHHFTS